jgi:hypothetical protein
MTEDAKDEIIEKVVRPTLGELADNKTKITVNGTGKFLVAGPQADSGLTGRKIIVDTYGGWALHGGGAFSGKDATKVDRSAGYMARYIAKNIVASELADECLVQLAYCIGLVDPVSVMISTYGTGQRSDTELASLVRKVFPLSPKGMIDHLCLRRPIFRKTATYGHFGRGDIEFTWEYVDAVDELKAKLAQSSSSTFVRPRVDLAQSAYLTRRQLSQNWQAYFAGQLQLDALVVRMTENKDKLEDHRKRQIPEIPNPRRKQLPWQVVKQPSEDAPKPGRSAGCALSSLC